MFDCYQGKLLLILIIHNVIDGWMDGFIFDGLESNLIFQCHPLLLRKVVFIESLSNWHAKGLSFMCLPAFFVSGGFFGAETNQSKPGINDRQLDIEKNTIHQT